MKFNHILALCIGLTFISCKKNDPEPENPIPSNPFQPTLFSVEGEMNGVPFNWLANGANYEQNLAPYNTTNVSSSNNFLRYGTSISTNNVNSVPYFMVEFSGFQGNSNDQLSTTEFLNYFNLGTYDFLNTSNQDTAVGINLLYEMDLDYNNIHQSANLAQPTNSYFIIDSITPVQTTSNNTDVYLKLKFEGTLKDPTKPGQDILITNGVMRILIDNFYEL